MDRKQLGLVEHMYYYRFGTLPATFKQSLFRNQAYYEKLVGIDEKLTALDTETQYYAKYYMAVLQEMPRMTPAKERQADKEVIDPRVEFRAVMQKYGINIPEALLVLAEEVFMPEEYRGLPSTE